MEERRCSNAREMTSPRPVDKRSRRLSAPSSFMERPPPESRRWVTVNRTSWRTAPSSMGYRIDLLPPGWQVDVLPWPEKQPKVAGWLPIAPRGYVELKDLNEVPAEEDFATIVTPPPVSRDSPGPLSPQEQTGCEKSARNALLALREEHVRLREANIKLRERELSKRQELDSLEHARDLTAQKLAAVQDDLQIAEEELEKRYQRQDKLNSKLVLCQEAILTAIKSVDVIYDRAKAASQECDPDECERQRIEESVVINACNASEVLTELLNLTSPAEDTYCHGSENNSEICPKSLEKGIEKAESPGKALVSRAPLRDLNV